MAVVHSSYLIKVEGRQWNGAVLITLFRILPATYECFVSPVGTRGQRGPLFSLTKQGQKTVFSFQMRAVSLCEQRREMELPMTPEDWTDEWEDSLKPSFIMTPFVCPWDRVQQVCEEQIMLVIYSYVKISVSAALWELILVANPAESTQIVTKCSRSVCMHTYILHTHIHTHMYGWTKGVLLLKNPFFSRGSAQLVLRLHVHLISQMTQDHVKGLKSFLHSRRLPVLLRVLYELA